MSPDFLAVEHALKISVANITNNIFFKFVLMSFFPLGSLWLFQIIQNYSSIFYIKFNLT